MKHAFLTLAILASSSAALACMPMPVEWNNRVRNLMAAEAMTALNVNVDAVKSVKTESIKVLKYEWVQSNAGYECHDKETLQAVFTVHYQSEKETCLKEVTVGAVRSYYEGAPKDSYTSSVNDAVSVCQKNP